MTMTLIVAQASINQILRRVRLLWVQRGAFFIIIWAALDIPSGNLT